MTQRNSTVHRGKKKNGPKYRTAELLITRYRARKTCTPDLATKLSYEIGGPAFAVGLFSCQCTHDRPLVAS